MTDPLSLLQQGLIIQSVVQTYANLIGSGMFYTFVLGLALTLIYIQTKSIGSVALVLMLVGGLLIPLVEPPIRPYFAIFIISATAFLIWLALRGRG